MAAPPSRKPLFAAFGGGQGVDGVGVHSRGLVARQDFQFITDFERIALDKGDIVFDLHRDFTALFASGWRGAEHPDRTRAGGHMNPGARGQQ